jgi:hypothetical protein
MASKGALTVASENILLSSPATRQGSGGAKHQEACTCSGYGHSHSMPVL